MATFLVDQSGANISNFAIGDKIVINLEGANTSETLTYLDLVSPLADRLNKATAVDGLAGTNYASPMSVNTAGTGVDIRIPDFDGTGTTKLITVSSTTLTPTQLLTRLSTHPEDFDIRSKGNTVVDWNDVTFDALKLAGFAPAASVRVFSMVQTAINDAVQGILNIGVRQTYLQTQGINIAAPAAGASADVAAAAAASRILTNVFSDPFTFSNNGGAVNPVFKPLNTQADQNLTTYYTNVFNAAVASAQSQAGVSQASIDEAVAYGNAVADQILAIRATDGFLRNVDGSQVKPSSFEPLYKNGIESAENLAGKDGTVSKLSDGTSLVGTGPQISAFSGNGTNLVTGVGASSPGVWRRAEDTLGNASYAGLASAEVASVNKTWFVPTTNFFSDRINPPPALDTVNYAANVAEVKTEASLLDIPLPTGTEVKVFNRTETVNGVTTVIPGLTTLGIVANDTSTSEPGYAGVVGTDAPKIIAGNSNGIDGIGTTSAERTVIAHVWANAEGGVGPNYAYQKVAQQLAINNNKSLADTALIFATLDQAFADGFENLWQEKWDVDYFWRPVSGVRNADQLPSTASLDDNSFTTRENTPQHPCHPSGTSVSAGLAATILRYFYGDNQTFTVSADVNPVSARLAIALAPAGGNVDGTPLEEVSRTYTSFDQVLNETRLSRIYAGAHFRFATEHGVELGLAVGNYFVNNNPTINQAPTITAATFSIDENSVVNTLIGQVVANDPNTGDKITFGITSGNTDINGNGKTPFAIDSQTGQLKVNDPSDLNFEKTQTFNLGITATDVEGLSAQSFFPINIKNVVEPVTFSKGDSDVFTLISGDNTKPSFLFTVNSNNARQTSEIGVFIVDDAAGTIDGVSPTQSGYAEKALSKAKSLFSIIDNQPNGFSENGLSRLVQFSDTARIRFYTINSKDATTDSVLNSKAFDKVNFSPVKDLNLTDLGGSFSINFNGLDISIKPSDSNFAIGTSLQDKNEGEVLDLTQGFDTTAFSQVKAEFTVNREAAFNNFVGFYKIENANGDIKKADGSIVSVGQSGYIQAAVAGQISGIDLTAANQSTQTTSGIFKAGSIFAPFIVINGSPSAILDSNPNNDPAVYFPFLGANTDKVDHIRLFGNNTFGFEDLPSGGDFDYNDIIVKVKLTPVA